MRSMHEQFTVVADWPFKICVILSVVLQVVHKTLKTTRKQLVSSGADRTERKNTPSPPPLHSGQKLTSLSNCFDHGFKWPTLRVPPSGFLKKCYKFYVSPPLKYILSAPLFTPFNWLLNLMNSLQWNMCQIPWHFRTCFYNVLWMNNYQGRRNMTTISIRHASLLQVHR